MLTTVTATGVTNPKRANPNSVFIHDFLIHAIPDRGNGLPADKGGLFVV